jgi:hypothetical protein
MPYVAVHSGKQLIPGNASNTKILERRGFFMTLWHMQAVADLVE